MVGAHVSIAGGVQNAPLNATNIGCNAIQIFSKNQTRWQSPPIPEESLEAWRENREQHKIEFVVIHDSYLINLSAPDSEKREKSIAAFLDEMDRAHQLEIPWLLTQPGSHMKEGEEWGIHENADSINRILDECLWDDVNIVLETTAGQGTNLGYRFEHLRDIIAGVKQQDRMRVCVDTCHIFAAGYELRTRDGYEKTFEQFDRNIGLDRLVNFHVNDSKKPLGSRRDRHDHIGDGEMGLEPFRMLMNDPRFKGIPKILETPGGDDGYRRNLETLRSLRMN